jgi:ABC-type multidrug transport system fused ATPase/permease subunit
MKAVGEFLVLQREEVALPLPPSFASALGIREGVVLYGVVLVPENREAAENRRLMTLIVTPFPHGSWSRLIRMSVTIGSRPGSLQALLKALNSLHIFCRHIEDITDGAEIGVLPSEEPIVPSVTLVVEIPLRGTVSADNEPLHASLLGVLDDPTSGAGALSSLQSALDQLNLKELGVRWISPMTTLNKLGHAEHSEKLRVARSVDTPEFGLEVSLLPWRGLLWPTGLFESYSEFQGKVGGRIMAVASMDSDEKIMAWYFYPYVGRLIIQFEIASPAFGLEHFWWEYIYNCVKEAEGTVLSSSSSARLNGTWVALQCTVMFELKSREGLEDPSSIVTCFRKLQGDLSFTQEFKELQKTIESSLDEIGPQLVEKDLVEKWKKKSLKFSSQLEKLVIWDPNEDSLTPRFPNLFAENPFNFTLPLELGKYNRLYDVAEEKGLPQRTRLQWAKSIKEKLVQEPGENIAIVGAHRAGKTTLLNLVYDLLRQQRDEAVIFVPVRITASVTPPHLLFAAISEQLESFKGGRWEKLSTSFRKARTRMAQLAEVVLSGVEVDAGPVTIKWKDLIKAKRRIEAETPVTTEEKLRSLLIRIEEEKEGALPEFLRLSLSAMRDALREAGEDMRLVVIIDEFSESAAWGDSRTLAVWRYAIESSDFSQMKWLFSTTRPVREVAGYSPITNIFFEVNVGSLRKQESERLIDAFSVSGWRQEDEAKLRPILTFPAREFLIGVTSGLPYLLQVACYHIYEAATHTNFPLINKALCRKVIIARVLPELADYLERQWSQVPETAQRFILDSLEALPATLRSPDSFMRFFQSWHIDLDGIPPGSMKALDRSGLRGEDNCCVAPIVGAWLLSRGIPKAEHGSHRRSSSPDPLAP